MATTGTDTLTSMVNSFDVGLGSPQLDYSNAASGTTTINVLSAKNSNYLSIEDVNVGQAVPRPDVNWHKTDNTKSDPSGYNADGTPEWGDGAIARSTTWTTDDEASGTPELAYAQGSGVTGRDYSDLT
ncbi:MAG: hypothetical protein BAJALOKI3v1_50048 [Promethearchaeota archaeon]|nr:MAG: hypothetical protein BAJALOKI3v1_50048 [Candidatus Lokiarchaeota archaeon]